MRTPRRRLRAMPRAPAPKQDRPDRPTSLRLSPGDLAYADALVGPEAERTGNDRLNRHRLLVEAVRLGLAAIGRRHGIRRPKPQ